MFNINNISIEKKLILGFTLLVTFILGIGIFAVVQLKEVNQTSTDMEQNWMPSVRYSGAMNTNLSDFRISELQLLLATDETQRNTYKKELDLHLKELEGNQKLYEPTIDSPEEKSLYENFKANWAIYMKAHDQVVDLIMNNKHDEAKILMREKNSQLFDNAGEYLDKLVELNAKGAKEASNKGDALYSLTRELIWGAIFVSVFLGMGLSSYIIKGIKKTIRETLDGVSVVSNKVAEVASRIASASEQLSEGTTQQASAIQETASSSEEMSMMVGKTVSNANQCLEIASESYNSSASGKKL